MSHVREPELQRITSWRGALQSNRSRERRRGISMAEKMKITWQREGNCLWHSDCEAYPKNSGIMIRIREEEKATLMKCGNCGKMGRYPVGGIGTVCVDVDPNDIAL